MLKASYEHGVRLPTAEELFGDGLIIQGSPALEPEISDKGVVGLHIDAPWTNGNRLRFNVDGFASRLSNLIVLGGVRTQNYANVDQASIAGVELDARLTLADALDIWVNGTLQDVRNRTQFVTGTSQPNFLDGKRIPNIPGCSATPERSSPSMGWRALGSPLRPPRCSTRPPRPPRTRTSTRSRGFSSADCPGMSRTLPASSRRCAAVASW